MGADEEKQGRGKGEAQKRRRNAKEKGEDILKNHIMLLVFTTQ